MTLSPLAPAARAPIANDQLLYEWDEWSVHDYFDFEAPELEQRLAEVSGRGSIALTLAVGEWICQRFSVVNLDPAPMQHLEASWAEQMQPGLSDYFETDDDQWRGIVRGPLSLVITIANDALFVLEEDDDIPKRAAWMTNLARHVLPELSAFDTWLELVLDRLIQRHPHATAEAESFEDDELGLGRPVARELFDTTLPIYAAADESRLIAAFLQRVDPQNPFLLANSP